MEVVDAFGIFDQQHATEHDLYKAGAKITLTVFFHWKTMKHFFLDNTLAENEWLQMNLLLTIVMVKEIPASLKWIFNNE